MHFDFIRPGGLWPSESVPSATDYQRFDVQQDKTINGDLGGVTVVPKSPIIIGGSGLASAFGIATGGVATRSGGRIFTGGNTDLPVLNARTRTIVFPALKAGVSVGPNVNHDHQLEEGYLQPVFGDFGAGIAFPDQPTFFMVNIPKRCAHNGARLFTASMQFIIRTRPQAVPTGGPFPRFTLIGHNYTGNVTAGFPTPGNLVAFSSPATWSAVTPHSVGDYVGPRATGSQNGYYFQVSSISGTGTTGSSEPTWPSTVGATVIDNPGANQIVWTCIGRNGIYPLKGATADSYYNGGGVQSVYFDPDPASGSNILDNGSNRYAFYFPQAAIDPAMVLVSFTLHYGSITVLGQE